MKVPAATLEDLLAIPEIVTAERGDRVQPEPFEATPLLVGVLFGDEDHA